MIERNLIKKIGLVLACGFLLAASFLFALEKTKGKVDSASNSVPVSALSQPGNKNTVKLLFAGDAMFDRYIRQIMQVKGSDYIFNQMRRVFAESDAAIVNLEGPITDNDSVSINTAMGERNNYIFTFDPGVIDVLKDSNISAVNIGNNHIVDFGVIGAKQTQQYLLDGGVGFFGNFAGNEMRPWHILNVNDLKIALVNYNQFSPLAEKRAYEDIEKAKVDSDIVVVYTHWGKEYETNASGRERELAHGFIDKGADLIIGSHPHVIQDKELYKGKMIYYSLGNLVFDQYFSPETKKGMLVNVEIDKRDFSMKYEEMFVQLSSNGKTEEYRALD